MGGLRPAQFLMTYTQYKKLAFIVVIGIVGLFLAGWLGKVVWHEATKERPHFSSGQIVKKDFDPAHYDDYTTQQYVGESCSGSGNNRTCTAQYVTVWHHEYVPDRWSVQIKNCNVYHKNGNLWLDKQSNPKCFKKWVGVDGGSYNSYHIGGNYAS